MTVKKGAVGIAVAVACAAALCLVLGACSGGGSQVTFSGKWTACEVTSGGTTITYEDADEDMKSRMDDTWFEFSDDGTVKISDTGSIHEGTWKATSTTEATAEAEGIEFNLKIENDKITVTGSASDTVVKLRQAK